MSNKEAQKFKFLSLIGGSNSNINEYDKKFKEQYKQLKDFKNKEQQNKK